MGKVWGVGRGRQERLHVASTATSWRWRNRRKKEGLIYAGTDDGLIQVTEDGGKTWRKIEQFPGVPETTLRRGYRGSQHDAEHGYALRQPQERRLQALPAARAPTRQELDVDHRRPAREGPAWPSRKTTSTRTCCSSAPSSAPFFTLDGGKKWIKFKGGLPTIPVRDIAIQRRENDLVLAHVRPGLLLLDDYSPLRNGPARWRSGRRCSGQGRQDVHPGAPAGGRATAGARATTSTPPESSRLGRCSPTSCAGALRTRPPAAPARSSAAHEE